MNVRILALPALLLAVAGRGSSEELVGERPYEMVWAKRTTDMRAPLIDFESLKGWTVETQDASASFTLSRQQQLWGQYVGKLVYRGEGKAPSVTLRPSEPIAAPIPCDCVNLWLYGNNWAWAPDPSTPPVNVDVLLRSRTGLEVPIRLGSVRWKEWWLMHARLTDDQLKSLADGVFLAGLRVTGGRNREDRLLFFDNLAVYQELLPPLQFEPRPARGVILPAGQTTGTNTGPGKLPFPTREETILPDNLCDEFTAQLEQTGDVFAFHYRGRDGHLAYRYRPASGTLGDVTAEWEGRQAGFQPLAEGGVFFHSLEPGSHAPPEAVELLRCEQTAGAVVSTWRCRRGARSVEVVYTFRLWGKSLVIDVQCPGGEIGEFRTGQAVGVQDPRLVTLPYLACESSRPAVLVTGPPAEPLFVSALLDHCRSNASELWALNRMDKGAAFNGGSRYLPKTDGRRNDCFERLFLTVSPRFEEVLPNVPNPPSPWMHVAGERLWRAHGASDREADYELWKKVARHGMTKVVITDHETGWRDGGESFTLRTRAAPNKGGDPGQAEYARKIRALGFRYGIYNNYTDFAPVNEHWDEDRVTRLSNGDWRTAWARCYNLKPARAVELEAKLAPIIQEKFRLDTAYCDVHTAVTPWRYCDYDARTPGAGTFAATFYAYGEIMLHQKRTWNGPVYSEGNNHWYYCGLTDGNYGQDQAARLAQNPWLVDFDLRKLHPLCCNFGMGNPGMFFGRDEGLGDKPAQRERRLDQFLAATLAFGHTGFLVLEGGMASAARSYFNLQQVHARYAQDVASDIRYADEHGNLVDASAAVATGAYRRSQIATTYSKGLKVIVNGHAQETWRTPEAELPPFGWFAIDTRSGELTAFSALIDGQRADYVDSPAYLYADGRGRFTRFAKAACDGQLIALRREDQRVELIPLENCSSFGVSLAGQSAAAVAVDEQGHPLGPAETRWSRGLVYVTAVPKAFSYLLTPGSPPAATLHSSRQEVVPGEKVSVSGESQHVFHAPANAAPGSRLWQTFENAWIDFTVVPLFRANLRVDTAAHVELLPNLPAEAEAQVALASHTQTVALAPKRAVQLDFPFDSPKDECVVAVPLRVAVGELTGQQTWWVKAEKTLMPLAALAEAYQSGQRLRGWQEQSLETSSGAQVSSQSMSCGEEVKVGIFMHPPYQTGVGYSYALLAPVGLPARPSAAFRCQIGKRDGSDPGDGILFRVAIVDPDGAETVVAERQWIQHAWSPLEADLAKWAGKQVRIKLICDVGPANNSSGDWGCWSDLRLESLEPVLTLSVHDQPVELGVKSPVK